MKASGPTRLTVPPGHLSPREFEIVEQRRLGRTYKEIAAELEISPNTLKSHLGRAFRKLNVRSSLECVSVVFAR